MVLSTQLVVLFHYKYLILVDDDDDDYDDHDFLVADNFISFYKACYYCCSFYVY